MEPFIIEEFLFFVLLVIAGGIALYYVVKVLLIRRPETAPQRIERIVAECEARLAELQAMREKLLRIQARMNNQAPEKIAQQGAETLRAALAEIERDIGELREKVALAKVAQAQLEAREVAAKVKEEIRGDFEKLELAAIECEARANACKEIKELMKYE
jgi:predicted RNA-binding protein with PIN domain